MIVLGVAYLSDASACVLKDGRLLSAISQERLNREKLWHGVPHQAIEAALDIAGVSLDDVDAIATHGLAPQEPPAEPFLEKRRRIEDGQLSPELKSSQLEALDRRWKHERFVLGERTPGYLGEFDRYGKPVTVYEHHKAHAASAYYGSGWDDCIAVTVDGWGEDGSSTVWTCKGGLTERIGHSHTFDSLGYFYGSVTKALGFKPHRHEGKVLGLAAHCTDPQSYEFIGSMVRSIPSDLRFIGCMENGLYRPNYEIPGLEDLAGRFDRTDIAAAAQIRLEEVVCELIDALPGEGLKVALAGGIFANVKLNQRIAQRPNVQDVYVFPNMGDGGLSVGAAWLHHHDATGSRPQPMDSATLGNEIEAGEAEEALKARGYSYTQSPRIERDIAELINDGHIVVRVSGRMEFGPRALGNRSILCDASDPGINDWLNQKLQRSEFMPFAPATLAEKSGEYYRGLDKGAKAARYMTMTYDCTPKMQSESPAAVHVDGTARPQIVDRSTYPDLHEILEHYYSLSGKASVINTSYNMHEEPIVCSASDVVRAFELSGLPYLAFADYLVEQKPA